MKLFETTDERWILREKEIIERDGCKCRLCGASSNYGAVLVAAPLRTPRYVEPWEYEGKDLVTLCTSCARRSVFEIRERTYGVLVGDCVTYTHGGYTNCGVVFNVDYDERTGYIASVEDGGDTTRLWITPLFLNVESGLTTYGKRKVSVEQPDLLRGFKKGCSLKDAAWSALARCLSKVKSDYNAENYWNYYFYDPDNEDKEFKLLFSSIDAIRKNNIKIGQAMNRAVHEERENS